VRRALSIAILAVCGIVVTTLLWALDTGHVAPTAGSSKYWANPGNTLAVDSSRASYEAFTSTEEWLCATLDPMAGLPSDATVVGVEVGVNGYYTGDSTDPAVYVYADDGAECIGANTPDTGTLPSGSGSEGWVTFGGATDLWGATWSASAVHDSGLVVAIEPRNGGENGTTYFVNAVRVKVYYTEASTGRRRMF
jgi:hypothetical protein